LANLVIRLVAAHRISVPAVVVPAAVAFAFLPAAVARRTMVESPSQEGVAIEDLEKRSHGQSKCVAAAEEGVVRLDGFEAPTIAALKDDWTETPQQQIDETVLGTEV